MSARPTKLRSFLLPLALAAILGCTGESREDGVPARSEAAPGLVLITIDGIPGAKLGALGGPVPTPALERVAQEGAAWADGWTACPMTRPGVATYLTGLTPEVHGVRDDRTLELPKGVPTLPELLAARGYRTAAFPDSSLLGAASGLLRGFDIVDDAPEVPSQGLTWLGATTSPSKRADHFRDWVSTLPPAQPFFAWIHFSRPLTAQVFGRSEAGEKEDSESEPKAPVPGDGFDESLIAIDAAVGTVLDAMEARGFGQSALFVVGTSADQGMVGEGLAGPGMSLEERAIRVPVIARFSGTRRPAEQAIWAPDVAVTLGAIAGVDLPGSEGLDLREAAPADRILFSWTWAPRDLMGWRASRAARSGNLKTVEGQDAGTFALDGSGARSDRAGEERLAEALARRKDAAPIAISLDAVGPLLEARGLKLVAVAESGRDFGPAARRREVALAFWKGQALDRYGRFPDAEAAYQEVLALDPDNLAALLTLGQVRALQPGDAGQKLLRRAVERYPAHPEVLHWYAHALWAESWRVAETLLRAIQPHLPHEGDILYDLACARSLDEDVEESEKMLRAALEAGYRPWTHIDSDPDLRNLRASGGFARVLRDYR